MRTPALAWSFALVISGCHGNRAPPISAGEGLAISQERALSVDSARVPLLSDCPPGKAVFRTDQGWSCGDLAVVDPREIERDRAEAQRAADAVGPLAVGAEDLRARVNVLERSPPFGTAAIACTPDLNATNNRLVFQQGGKLIHQGTVEFNAFCPIYATHNPVTWTRLKVLYGDPDGQGTASHVKAALRRLFLRGTSTEPVTVVELNSDDFADTTPVEHEVVIPGTLDFEGAYYYLQVSLAQTQATDHAFFGGFTLAD